jgi:kynurenine formamidase
VLIRTGWGRFFATDNARYLEVEPGTDVPAARWATKRDVVAIGSDNMAVEVLPNPDRGMALPVHQRVLAEAGVHLIENLALDELARDQIIAFASSCWQRNSRAQPAVRCIRSRLFNETPRDCDQLGSSRR